MIGFAVAAVLAGSSVSEQFVFKTMEGLATIGMCEQSIDTSELMAGNRKALAQVGFSPAMIEDALQHGRKVAASIPKAKRLVAFKPEWCRAEIDSLTNKANALLASAMASQ